MMNVLPGERRVLSVSAACRNEVTRNSYVALGVRLATVVDVVSASAITSAQDPAVPSAAMVRCSTRNPPSLAELSVHVTSALVEPSLSATRS